MKNSFNKSKNQKTLILSNLEKEELELIKRLQYSQDVHDGACKELEGAITLGYDDYVKNFGDSVDESAKQKSANNSPSK